MSGEISGRIESGELTETGCTARELALRSADKAEREFRKAMTFGAAYGGRGDLAGAEDRIAGRLKAEAAIALLMDDLKYTEVPAAMRAIRAAVDAVLGPTEQPRAESTLSVMSPQEATEFRKQTCHYAKYAGRQWRDVPREYIATIADFGLELQRYLRSELGQQHLE